MPDYFFRERSCNALSIFFIMVAVDSCPQYSHDEITRGAATWIRSGAQYPFASAVGCMQAVEGQGRVLSGKSSHLAGRKWLLKKNSKNFQLDFKIYCPQQRKFPPTPNKRADFKWRPQLWLRNLWRRGRDA
jgi:hypothetical protein